MTATLANGTHPVYKRIILLNGLVFSKSDFTHAAQQYSSLRDDVIAKLCEQGIFIKQDVFAKKMSTGTIEYLEGYIKHVPSVNDNAFSTIEESVSFGGLLAHYDITVEQYLKSFTKKRQTTRKQDGTTDKYALTRADIKLKSYLFSANFADFINKSQFYSERFVISDDAICLNHVPIVPTTSNTGSSPFFLFPLLPLERTWIG